MVRPPQSRALPSLLATNLGLELLRNEPQYVLLLGRLFVNQIPKEESSQIMRPAEFISEAEEAGMLAQPPLS